MKAIIVENLRASVDERHCLERDRRPSTEIVRSCSGTFAECYDMIIKFFSRSPVSLAYAESYLDSHVCDSWFRVGNYSIKLSS